MELLFGIMSFALIAFAIGVVAFRNPIYSALCLIGNMIVLGAMYASLTAHFLAAVQIIVYAGAVMVLVMFVLMLLNLKHEEARPRNTPYIIVAVLAGAGFLAMLVPLIGAGFHLAPAHDAVQAGTLVNIGKRLYTDYVFPFEAAAILLMAALVGAVMLAKSKGQERSNGAA